MIVFLNSKYIKINNIYIYMQLEEPTLEVFPLGHLIQLFAPLNE